MENIVNSKAPLDPRRMGRMIDRLCTRYGSLSRFSIGRSLFGREIEALRFGRGEKEVLYVGAHHGMEWITSLVLLKFCEDLAKYHAAGRTLKNCDLAYLYDTKSILVVPMLNPDGVELQLNGPAEDLILRERLLRMNGDSADFSHWQANGRGVDLNHNYDALWREGKEHIARADGILGGGPTKYSGEFPESEPETRALCDFIRMRDIQLLLCLHSQGEEIYYEFGDDTPKKSRALAEVFARLTGYRAMRTEGSASFSGCKDWFIREFGRPGFTIEVGRGENPLPVKDMNAIYRKLLELLLIAPVL
ncbi:M14 family metallopeptidase [Feifania hominis]|uniref:Peptidase M14 domain-containing protein n=1 Tax=Feifania hominis TaxID=2763660 RepID=A0A926HU47_9FIRM|nr:M14 family metallocarboxypeptidase [Feifania hominis]MBC8536539.1 hypothetical protein [Feifania hominis]